MLGILQIPETMNSSKILPPLLLASTLIALLPLGADEIKLKSGQTLTGRITYEAADIVKIEIPVSASIKETKIIGRADIESIVKDAPDDVEFNKLQTLVPAASMLSAENYRKMLETGPDAFLKNHPDSKHVAKVKEIQATLAEELDKVERGFMKVDGEWYSPQDKVAYKELIESKIRLLRMESNAKGNNYSQFIAAMREFEVIEESYLGSPAFPKAVELAKQVVPALGRQLQSMAANVDYQNAEYEKALAASNPEARARLAAARAQEDQAFSQAIDADKKAGVKWLQFNPRNKQGIEEALRLAAAELNRIQAFDTAALAKQAEILVEADKLIAQDKIADARTKVAEATAIVTQTAGASTSKSKSTPKSSSKGKGNAKAGSYIAALNGKINDRIAEEQAKSKAKAAASESEALTANLRKAGDATDAGTTEEAGKPEGEETAETAATGETAGETAPKEEKPAAETPVDEFAALGASSKKSDSKEKEKESGKSSKSKSKKSDPGDEGEDEEGTKEKKPRPAPVVEEEGMPFWIIPGGITLLAVIGIAVMKFLGLGGKKGDE